MTQGKVMIGIFVAAGTLASGWLVAQSTGKPAAHAANTTSVTTTSAATSTATTSTATTTSTAAAPADAASIQQNLEGVLEVPASDNEYHYDPQGRRDPFRSLIGSKEVGRGGQGLGGFLVEEIDLQGIVKTKQGLVGMVTGPDNNGYLLRVGDRVFDGEVVRITPTSVVFRQETREIVKDLANAVENRR